jgi:hypothetical protein
MGNDILTKLAEKYPFITLCVYSNTEYIGIVQNRNADITTIYDFAIIHDQAQKQTFLELGNTWWWESNRQVPINIFLKEDWQQFRFTLRTFNNRELEILHGPVCSLNNISSKKGKRRSITLVKRML